MTNQLTDDQLHHGLKALLQCTASELEDYSPNIMAVYEDEVRRVHAALVAAHAGKVPVLGECKIITQYEPSRDAFEMDVIKGGRYVRTEALNCLIGSLNEKHSIREEYIKDMENTLTQVANLMGVQNDPDKLISAIKSITAPSPSKEPK